MSIRSLGNLSSAPIFFTTPKKNDEKRKKNRDNEEISRQGSKSFHSPQSRERKPDLWRAENNINHSFLTIKTTTSQIFSMEFLPSVGHKVNTGNFLESQGSENILDEHLLKFIYKIPNVFGMSASSHLANGGSSLARGKSDQTHEDHKRSRVIQEGQIKSTWKSPVTQSSIPPRAEESDLCAQELLIRFLENKYGDISLFKTQLVRRFESVETELNCIEIQTVFQRLLENFENYSHRKSSIKELLKLIRPLDIKKIKELVEKNEETGNAIVGKNVVLLLGLAGSDKNSVHCVLTNQPAKLYEIEPESMIIGKCFIENDEEVIVCDTPAFSNEREPEIDISNGVSLMKNIGKAGSVRPVIVFSSKDFEAECNKIEDVGGVSFMISKVYPTAFTVNKDSNSYLFTGPNLNINVKKVVEGATSKSELICELSAMASEPIIFNKSNVPRKILKHVLSQKKITDPHLVFQDFISSDSRRSLTDHLTTIRRVITYNIARNETRLVLEKINDIIYLKKVFKRKPDVIGLISTIFEEINTFFIQKYFDSVRAIDNSLYFGSFESIKINIYDYFRNYELTMKYFKIFLSMLGWHKLFFFPCDLYVNFFKKKSETLIQQLCESGNAGYNDLSIIKAIDFLTVLNFEDFPGNPFNYCFEEHKKALIMKGEGIKEDLKGFLYKFDYINFSKTYKIFNRFRSLEKELKLMSVEKEEIRIEDEQFCKFVIQKVEVNLDQLNFDELEKSYRNFMNLKNTLAKSQFSNQIYLPESQLNIMTQIEKIFQDNHKKSKMYFESLDIHNENMDDEQIKVLKSLRLIAELSFAKPEWGSKFFKLVSRISESVEASVYSIENEIKKAFTIDKINDLDKNIDALIEVISVARKKRVLNCLFENGLWDSNREKNFINNLILKELTRLLNDLNAPDEYKLEKDILISVFFEKLISRVKSISLIEETLGKSELTEILEKTKENYSKIASRVQELLTSSSRSKWEALFKEFNLLDMYKEIESVSQDAKGNINKIFDNFENYSRNIEERLLQLRLDSFDPELFYEAKYMARLGDIHGLKNSSSRLNGVLAKLKKSLNSHFETPYSFENNSLPLKELILPEEDYIFLKSIEINFYYLSSTYSEVTRGLADLTKDFLGNHKSIITSLKDVFKELNSISSKSFKQNLEYFYIILLKNLVKKIKCLLDFKSFDEQEMAGLFRLKEEIAELEPIFQSRGFSDNLKILETEVEALNNNFPSNTKLNTKKYLEKNDSKVDIFGANKSKSFSKVNQSKLDMVLASSQSKISGKNPSLKAFLRFCSCIKNGEHKNYKFFENLADFNSKERKNLSALYQLVLDKILKDLYIVFKGSIEEMNEFQAIEEEIDMKADYLLKNIKHSYTSPFYQNEALLLHLKNFFDSNFEETSSVIAYSRPSIPSRILLELRFINKKIDKFDNFSFDKKGLEFFKACIENFNKFAEIGEGLKIEPVTREIHQLHESISNKINGIRNLLTKTLEKHILSDLEINQTNLIEIFLKDKKIKPFLDRTKLEPQDLRLLIRKKFEGKNDKLCDSSQYFLNLRKLELYSVVYFSEASRALENIASKIKDLSLIEDLISKFNTNRYNMDFMRLKLLYPEIYLKYRSEKLLDRCLAYTKEGQQIIYPIIDNIKSVKTAETYKNVKMQLVSRIKMKTCADSKCFAELIFLITGLCNLLNISSEISKKRKINQFIWAPSKDHIELIRDIFETKDTRKLSELKGDSEEYSMVIALIVVVFAILGWNTYVGFHNKKLAQKEFKKFCVLFSELNIEDSIVYQSHKNILLSLVKEKRCLSSYISPDILLKKSIESSDRIEAPHKYTKKERPRILLSFEAQSLLHSKFLGKSFPSYEKLKVNIDDDFKNIMKLLNAEYKALQKKNLQERRQIPEVKAFYDKFDINNTACLYILDYFVDSYLSELAALKSVNELSGTCDIFTSHRLKCRLLYQELLMENKESKNDKEKEGYIFLRMRMFPSFLYFESEFKRYVYFTRNSEELLGEEIKYLLKLARPTFGPPATAKKKSEFVFKKKYTPYEDAEDLKYKLVESIKKIQFNELNKIKSFDCKILIFLQSDADIDTLVEFKLYEMFLPITFPIKAITTQEDIFMFLNSTSENVMIFPCNYKACYGQISFVKGFPFKNLNIIQTVQDDDRWTSYYFEEFIESFKQPVNLLRRFVLLTPEFSKIKKDDYAKIIKSILADKKRAHLLAEANRNEELNKYEPLLKDLFESQKKMTTPEEAKFFEDIETGLLELDQNILRRIKDFKNESQLLSYISELLEYKNFCTALDEDFVTNIIFNLEGIEEGNPKKEIYKRDITGYINSQPNFERLPKVGLESFIMLEKKKDLNSSLNGIRNIKEFTKKIIKKIEEDKCVPEKSFDFYYSLYTEGAPFVYESNISNDKKVEYLLSINQNIDIFPAPNSNKKRFIDLIRNKFELKSDSVARIILEDGFENFEALYEEMFDKDKRLIHEKLIELEKMIYADPIWGEFFKRIFPFSMDERARNILEVIEEDKPIQKETKMQVIKSLLHDGGENCLQKYFNLNTEEQKRLLERNKLVKPFKYFSSNADPLTKIKAALLKNIVINENFSLINLHILAKSILAEGFRDYNVMSNHLFPDRIVKYMHQCFLDISKILINGSISIKNPADQLNVILIYILDREIIFSEINEISEEIIKNGFAIFKHKPTDKICQPELELSQLKVMLNKSPVFTDFLWHYKIKKRPLTVPDPNSIKAERGKWSSIFAITTMLNFYDYQAVDDNFLHGKSEILGPIAQFLREKKLESFAHLFFRNFFFHIKAGVPLKEPLSQFNDHLGRSPNPMFKDIKLRLATNQLLLNSDEDAKIKLIYGASTKNPIPIIDYRKSSRGFVEQCYWILNRDVPLLFSYGYDDCKGKSLLLNWLFGSNFDCSDGSFPFNGTVDLVTNLKFGDREFYLADGHGMLDEGDKRMTASLADILIIQTSADDFDSFEYIKQELESLSFKSAVLIMRDYCSEEHSFLKEYYTRKYTSIIKAYFIPKITDQATNDSCPEIVKLRKDMIGFIENDLKEDLRKKRQKALTGIKEFEIYLDDVVYIDRIFNCSVKPEFTLLPKLIKLHEILISRKCTSEYFSLEKEIKLSEKSTAFYFLENLLLHSESVYCKFVKYDYFMKKLKSLSDSEGVLALSIENLFREMAHFIEKDPAYKNKSNISQAYLRLIMKGYPFEIIDGNLFHMPKALFDELDIQEGSKKIFVISFFGYNDRKKSEIFRYLFGFDFRVHQGRSTKGLYGTILKYNATSSEQYFDSFLIIESEGLQLMNTNEEYDKKMTIFCLAASNLIINNGIGKSSKDIAELIKQVSEPLKTNNLPTPTIYNEIHESDLEGSFKFNQARNNVINFILENETLQNILVESLNRFSKSEFSPNEIKEIKEWFAFANYIYEALKIDHKMLNLSEIARYNEDEEQKQWIDDTLANNFKDISELEKTLDEDQIEDYFKKQEDLILKKFDERFHKISNEKIKSDNKIYLKRQLGAIKSTFKQIKRKEHLTQEIQENYNNDMESINDLISEIKEAKTTEEEFDIIKKQRINEIPLDINDTGDNISSNENFDFIYTNYNDSLDEISKFQIKNQNDLKMKSQEKLNVLEKLQPFEEEDDKNKYEYKLIKSEFEKHKDKIFTRGILELMKYFMGEQENIAEAFIKNKLLFEKLKTSKNTAASFSEELKFSDFLNFLKQNIMQMGDIFDTEDLASKLKDRIKKKVSEHRIDRDLIQDIVREVNEFIMFEDKFFNIFGKKLHSDTKSSLHACSMNFLFESMLKKDVEFVSEVREYYVKKINDFNKVIKELIFYANLGSSKVLLKVVLETLQNFYKQEYESMLKDLLMKKAGQFSRSSIQNLCEDKFEKSDRSYLFEYIKDPKSVIKKEFLDLWGKETILLNKESKKIADKYNALIPLLEDRMKNILTKLENIDIKDNFLMQDSQSSYQKQEKAAFQFFLGSLINDKSPNCSISETEVEPSSELKKIKSSFVYQASEKEKLLETLIKSVSKDPCLKECSISDFKQFTKHFVEAKKSDINLFENWNKTETFEILERRCLDCEAKCPCCKRLCDVQHHGTKDSRHACGLGHQFGAFVGVKIKIRNNLHIPSLIPCEKWEDSSWIISGGRKMSWSEFKKEYSNWNFDFNLMSEAEKTSLFSKFAFVWDLIGEEICKDYQIEQFCTVKEFEPLKNTANTASSSLHFIFCMDSSGSMSGSSWNNLLAAFHQFIKRRVSYPEKNSNTKDHVSIITFSDTAEEVCCYLEIEDKNYGIKFIGSGTNFGQPLKVVQNIMSKPVIPKNESSLIIFLSDGDADYPAAEIKALKDSYYNQIQEFWAMGFGSGNFDVLRKMVDYFGTKGKYFNILDASSLTEKYQELAQILPS